MGGTHWHLHCSALVNGGGGQLNAAAAVAGMCGYYSITCHVIFYILLCGYSLCTAILLDTECVWSSHGPLHWSEVRIVCP